MKIGVHQLKHNERVEYSVIEYLEERMESLVRTSEKKLGDDYCISLDRSGGSEAFYLSIENEVTEEMYKVSFRNHGNFADSMYDSAIFFSLYKNWTECKKHFLNVELPKMLVETNKEA